MTIKTNTKIAMILLIVPLFLIALFFLPRNNIFLQFGLTIILLGVSYFAMNCITVGLNRKKLYLILPLVLIFVSVLGYLPFRERLNITERIYYQETDRGEYTMDREHYWYSQDLYVPIYNLQGDFAFATLVIAPLEEPNLYVYDLYQDLSDMEKSVDTDGEIVQGMMRTSSSTFFTTFTEEAGITYTNVYLLNDVTYETELFHKVEGRFDIYTEIEGIILVEKNIEEDGITYIDGVSKVYEPDGFDGLNLLATTNYEIYDMKYIEEQDAWYIVTDVDMKGICLNIYDALTFTYEGAILEGLHDYPSIQVGKDNVLLFDDVTTYVINRTEHLDIQQFEGELHFNGHDLYVSHDAIYDENLQMISNNFFLDLDHYVAGENRAYLGRIDQNIVFSNEEIRMVEPLPEKSGLFIQGYARFVLGGIGMMLSGVILAYGFRRPKVLFHITKQYQIQRMTCKKCNSDNNIMTLPHICDYCDSQEFIIKK